MPEPYSDCSTEDSSNDHASVTAPRFAVVGWATGPLSPRGQRVKHLVAALRRHGAVERIGPRVPALTSPVLPPTNSASLGRRVGRSLVHHVFLDRFEPAACWRLLRWRPRVEVAVLVGFPFAPLTYASRRLATRGIPYIVDIGDPWVLTHGGCTGGPFKQWRASRAEDRLWRGALGAIVTTPGQATALTTLFPHLDVLVRPNGYEPSANVAQRGQQLHHRTLARRSRLAADELRLVHYGSLCAPRLDLAAFVTRLIESGRWRRIVLRQHGNDWDHTLDRLAQHIEVERRAALPWSKVLDEAQQFDAALVVGNHNPVQLPSKVVQYLTLPIPRIALVNGHPADALTAYVADKSAWVTVGAAASDPAARVAELVNRRWTADDFEAPSSEGWPAVEKVLCDFILATSAVALSAGALPTLSKSDEYQYGTGVA
jgi:hypothetical protein